VSNYFNKAQKRDGVKEIFPSMTTIQKPGGGKFIKPFTKIKSQKTVSQVKADAAKAKLEAAKFELGQTKAKLNKTFQGSDKALNKLKKTINILKRK